MIKNLLICATLLLFCSCNSQPGLSSSNRNSTILAFGDSITYGTGAGQGEGYPAVLSQIISKTVISSGIPGETTSQGLRRLPALLDKHKPGLIILCEGTNDMALKLDDAKTASNLKTMIDMVQKRNIHIILVGAPRPGGSYEVPAFFSELAEEFNVPNDSHIMKRILSDPNLRADALHPNREGYMLLAETIADLLKKSGYLK